MQNAEEAERWPSAGRVANSGGGAGKRAYPLGRAQFAKLPHNRGRGGGRCDAKCGSWGGFGLSVERRVSRGESVGGSRWPAGWGAEREQVEGEVSKGTPSPDPEGTPTRQLSGVISTNSPAGLARSRRIFSGVWEMPRESTR